MKKLLIYISLFIVLVNHSYAQDNIYPGAVQTKTTAIVNATIHTGNGQVIENGTIVFDKGKITAIAANLSAPAGAVIIDAKGRRVYPGLILSNTDLGIKEVGAGTRATNDFAELGDINPNVRAIVAYNTDSKIINTLRTNGILLANVVPAGGLISGSSSVVQLDAWNWEDAAYHMDGGVRFNMPNLLNRPNPFAAFFGRPQNEDVIITSLERIESVRSYLREAKAYASEKSSTATNLKYEALTGLFNKTKKLFVYCNLVKEMLIAIDFKKEFDLDLVIVGGSESYQIADLLKQHEIPVILNQMHSLPTMMDDDVDQPYKTPAELQKAGVLFAITDSDGQTRGRNLMFNAGTAVAYGLSKEEALAATNRCVLSSGGDLNVSQ